MRVGDEKLIINELGPKHKQFPRLLWTASMQSFSVLGHNLPNKIGEPCSLVIGWDFSESDRSHNWSWACWVPWSCAVVLLLSMRMARVTPASVKENLQRHADIISVKISVTMHMISSSKSQAGYGSILNSDAINICASANLGGWLLFLTKPFFTKLDIELHAV